VPGARNERWWRIALAGLSAVALVLSCPGFGLWWLGYLQWIPYFAAIQGARPRTAFAYGWLTGTVAVFWGFFWMTELLVKFAGFPRVAALPLTLLFAVWHGALWAISAWLITRVRPSGMPLWLAAPVVWVAGEALLPNLFPLYMALSWCWRPVLIQTAELGGVTMVSGLMIASNAAVYELIRCLRAGQPGTLRHGLAALLLLAGVPLYGLVRIAQVREAMAAAPKVRWGVVQGNMSIRQMADRRWRARILQAQQQLTARLEAQGAQVAVWGENAYSNHNAFTRQSTHDLPEGHPWRVRQGFSIPVLFGVNTRDATGATPYPWNSAMLLDEQGRVAGLYDKVYRLAFGEYAPLVDPRWYLKRFPNASHIASGPGPGVIGWGAWRLGPLICYEDILPRFARQTVGKDVHVFVNLTNDAWFGKTDEPLQHLGLAVFRAVEHRRGLLRAVNTGVSVFVDPTGATHHTLRVTDPDVEGPQPAEGFVADVPMMDPAGRTLYGLTGELFNALCVGAVLAMAWRRRREDAGGQPPSARWSRSA
jgi:apolipoprotein N-acyltransferase